MVRQHDAAGAEPDGGGVGGDVRDEDRGGRRSDRIDAVVLGVPDALVAGCLRHLGELNAAGEALGDGFAVADGGEIENGDGNGSVDGDGHGPRARYRRSGGSLGAYTK